MGGAQKPTNGEPAIEQRMRAHSLSATGPGTDRDSLRRWPGNACGALSGTQCAGDIRVRSGHRLSRLPEHQWARAGPGEGEGAALCRAGVMVPPA